MATIWSGAIAFGLVNIPVKLVSAVRSHDLSFRLLHQDEKEGLCPVKNERVCKRSGKEVPWSEVVKGYEYAKEQFVVLSDADFEQAALATSKTMEVQDFAPEAEVDARYFEKPYYLIPQAGGEKAYALLREAMRETRMLGIGTITLRRKQYLASIKPLRDAIVLDLMRFADEVLGAEEYRFPSAEDFRPQELKMAQQLIGNLSQPFEPEKYRDEYKANLERIIAGKMEGRTVTLREAAEPEMTGVVDLMARLQASLESTKRPAAKKKRSGSKRKSAA